jgi:D-sedoheptulose 7-phosphate isomerase
MNRKERRRLMREEQAKEIEGNAPPPNRVQSPEYQGRGVFVDETGFTKLDDFSRVLNLAVIKTQVKSHQITLDLNDTIFYLRHRCRETNKIGKKIIFIGNGGSSAIASHMAVDFSKNGGMRAIAFNDAPTLTCLANDFGQESIFSKQIEYYADKGDLIMIVSSSGKSPNIIKAAEQAFVQGIDLVTFSGMNADNVLRRKGMLNFWVPATDYGIVELAHLTLLHSIVSIA